MKGAKSNLTNHEMELVSLLMQDWQVDVENNEHLFQIVK